MDLRQLMMNRIKEAFDNDSGVCKGAFEYSFEELERLTDEDFLDNYERFVFDG